MTKRIVIVGGGLAGLSAACYALASGFSATIVEHNLALGGVCTALMSGRQVVQLLCADEKQPFVVPKR